jgi:tRNA threonylcarbamoyladenosine biosynthesis protein TsaE
LRDWEKFLGKVYSSNSPRETITVAEELGKILTPGCIIALVGELGAGKTVFTKGVASGLGVKQEVVSPSFQVARFYLGRLPLCHLDFYRLEDGDRSVLGLDDYLLDDGVTIIEWAERITQFVPDDSLAVRITCRGESQRKIEFSRWRDMAMQIKSGRGVGR